MNNEQILALFSTSPDFREDLASYQIDHITGRSSGLEYLPPECRTMKTNGVCFNPDSLCKREWMTHPLTYYRVKGKNKGKKPKPESDSEKTDNADKTTALRTSP
jgi:DNA primase large subunit